MAKYEIPAQKWVDLSLADYGAALLNDCKYGHSVYDGVLDLNLLRSPHFPDPTADRATHQFTYSFYPHGGDHRIGNVMQAGYELNVPLRVIPMNKHRPSVITQKLSRRTLFQVDDQRVVIEAVKLAEDDDAIIVRLFDSSGSGACVHLTIALEECTVSLVSLLEEPIASIHVFGEANHSLIYLTFAPFEIHTLKILRSR